MRNAIASNIWRFSTTRMLHEYVERLYLPAPDGGDSATPSRLTAVAVKDSAGS